MDRLSLDAACAACREAAASDQIWLRRECSVRSQILSEIAKISTRFISAPAADIDAGINEALQITGELAQVDRAYVFLFNDCDGTMTNTHEWCAESVPPQMHELQQVPVADFAWSASFIRPGNVLHVPRVKDVPEEGAFERAVFESGHIQSLLCVPLICRNESIGFVGFDSVRQEKQWSDDDTALLRIVGDVLASAIDRKNASVALHESEEKWRVLAETSADHIMIIDRDMRVQFVNRMVSELPPDQIIGTNILSWLGDENVDRARECIQTVLDTGQPSRYDCSYTDLHGVTREFRCRVGAITREGVPVALGVSATEVTESVRTRQALVESETRLRQMAEYIDSIFWLSDADTGEILYVSPSYETIFKLDAQCLQADQWSWLQRLHPEDRDRVFHTIQRDGVSGSYELEYRLLDDDGSIRWVRDRAFPVYDQSGRLYRRAGIAEDITDRRRAEEELSRARRLESAGQVAGQIAHDFNNLLAPMVAYPDLIRGRIEAPQSIMAMLDDLEEAAMQMADINQQLLTLGRRGHYNITPVDLNALTDQVLRTLDLPDTLEIVREYSHDCPQIMAGRAQLARVFANITRNAAEAMSGHGTLTFRTRLCGCEDQPHEWESRSEQPCVVWSITDTGPGIAADTIDQIFDPYFSTKKSDTRRGSGLGLAVAHSVVRDHSGHLAVTSELGKGATFSVYLPRPETETVAEILSQPIPKGNRERVLVIDDDVIQQRVVRTILQDLGYSVTRADSGDEAIKKVTAESFDLLLLDMVMPGLDGTETLRQIRSIVPHQPVIMLSGYAPNERVQEALRLGAHRFVSKPVAKRELAEAVRSALDASVATLSS